VKSNYRENSNTQLSELDEKKPKFRRFSRKSFSA